jgi:succinate-semialdehyde dehydrogenase / glutarate-semialdehyde dehydrogenase
MTAIASSMEIINPANFDVIDNVPISSAGDIERALNAAQDGKKVWAATPMWKRREILGRYLDLLTAQKLEVAHTLCLETGKPLEQAVDEVSGGIRMFREYVNRVIGLHGTTIPLDSQEGLERDVLMTHRQPLGVLAAILPFNFPIDTFSHKTGAALVTGNAVIVKPGEDAPLAVIHAVRLMHEAGVPENVIQVVTGKGDVGAMITDTPKVNAISFTGSTATGSRHGHRDGTCRLCPHVLQRAVLRRQQTLHRASQQARGIHGTIARVTEGIHRR